MNLTLSQAAERMGKTRRQIRYLIQQGRLEARKDGGRWVVDSEHLPISNIQREAQARQAGRLRRASRRYWNHRRGAATACGTSRRWRWAFLCIGAVFRPSARKRR